MNFYRLYIIIYSQNFFLTKNCNFKDKKINLIDKYYFQKILNKEESYNDLMKIFIKRSN